MLLKRCKSSKETDLSVWGFLTEPLKVVSGLSTESSWNKTQENYRNSHPCPCANMDIFVFCVVLRAVGSSSPSRALRCYHSDAQTSEIRQGGKRSTYKGEHRVTAKWLINEKLNKQAVHLLFQAIRKWHHHQWFIFLGNSTEVILPSCWQLSSDLYFKKQNIERARHVISFQQMHAED